METYQEFLARINTFEKRELHYGYRYFMGNPSISLKVDKNNTFRSFYGDTVVFALDDAVKKKLAAYTDLLYQSASECFCERLVPGTLHVTLHDLSNAPALRDVAEALFENELRAIAKMEALKKFENYKIKMKSKYIFNMVDVSLVLGLYPASEDEYLRLMELYSVFDDVRKLDYPFTPHITLAYYNINGFPPQTARTLEDTVKRLNHQEEFELELNTDHLYYQKFRSMNDYINIFSFKYNAGSRT